MLTLLSLLAHCLFGREREERSRVVASNVPVRLNRVAGMGSFCAFVFVFTVDLMNPLRRSSVSSTSARPAAMRSSQFPAPFQHVAPHRVPKPSSVGRSPVEHFHDYLESMQANTARRMAARRSGAWGKTPASPPSPTQAEPGTPPRSRSRGGLKHTPRPTPHEVSMGHSPHMEKECLLSNDLT